MAKNVEIEINGESSETETVIVENDAEAAATVEKTDETAVTEGNAKSEKTVSLTLPFIGGDDEEVFVGLNGRTFLIKRGVTVEVPEGVKEIIDRKEAYARSADATSRRLQERSSIPVK